MLAHLECVVELEPSGFELTKQDGKRHQLAHACRRSQNIRLLLEQHQILVGVEQDGVFRLGFECRLFCRLSRSCNGAGTKNGNGACRCDLDHFVKARGVHGVTGSK